MMLRLAEKFRKSTRELRHPSIAQYLPSNKQAAGYNSSFLILSQAIALTGDNPKDAQWDLATAMKSLFESWEKADKDDEIEFDIDLKKITNVDLLKSIIKDNIYLYKEECRLLGLASEKAITSVDTRNTVSLRTGKEVSSVEAFYKQPDINNPKNEVVHSKAKPPALKIVK